MYKEKKVLAIIPARGGTKGLPGKNIKEICGKPLIAWTIEQANNSKLIDTCIVSTDDQRIAEISKKYNGMVPFLRPSELAMDFTPISDVIFHTLDYFKKDDRTFDVIVLLECTSPMRYPADIDNVIRTLIDNPDADNVVSVCKVTNDHPLWANTIRNGYLDKYIEISDIESYSDRQKLDTAYLPYSIYAARTNSYLKTRTFYTDKTLPYLLKREQKVDIDDEVDFYITECIMKKYLV